MNFIKRFLRAWKDATEKHTYYEQADYPEFWTKDDIRWLGGMLAHPSGQKLMFRMNNMVVRSAIDATKRTLNPRYQCGIARGMNLMKAFIDQEFNSALALAVADNSKTDKSDAERESDEVEQLLSQVL